MRETKIRASLFNQLDRGTQADLLLFGQPRPPKAKSVCVLNFPFHTANIASVEYSVKGIFGRSGPLPCRWYCATSRAWSAPARRPAHHDHAGHQTRPASLSEARNVSLMRVCQPSPLARSAASTSASSRNLTGSLVTAALGRPRGLRVVPSYRSACLKNAAVSSGASSGSVHVAGVEVFFAVIGFPHADNAAYLAARRPDNDHQAGI